MSFLPNVGKIYYFPFTVCYSCMNFVFF